jgi:hypothetical protein
MRKGTHASRACASPPVAPRVLSALQMGKALNEHLGMGDEAWRKVEASNEALTGAAHVVFVARRQSHYQGMTADMKKEAAAGNSSRLDALSELQ